MLELHSGVNSPATICLNDYTTLRAKVNGKVLSANFKIFDSNFNEVKVFYHKPPQLNYPHDGYVELAFDPKHTITLPGEYELRLIVNYDNGQGGIETEELVQKVEFQTQSLIQWYIDELRVALGDDISLSKYIPTRFYIRDPNVKMWEDEELYKFLQLALLDINNAHPVNIRFSLTNPTLPVNFLIYGAMIRALTAAGLIEVYNWYDISSGPVKVSLYKGDKLKDFANWLNTFYIEPLSKFKISYAYYTAPTKIMVLTKMPFRVIRPLTMLYGYHNFFTG
mgnify:CR=1 FL=1